MNRWVNKSEVLLVLERGGRVISHDCRHWLEDAKGDYVGGIRYSLWNILYRTRAVALKGKEMRPPSRLGFYIWTPKKGDQANVATRKT